MQDNETDKENAPIVVDLGTASRKNIRKLKRGEGKLEAEVQEETTHLDGLRATGLPFAEATLETIARCQRRYIEGSERIRQHMRQYSCRPGERPRLIDMFLPSLQCPVSAETPLQ